MKSRVLISALVVGIPLVLWLDYWLATRFAVWATGEKFNEMSYYLGFLAFFVLAVSQGIGMFFFVTVKK